MNILRTYKIAASAVVLLFTGSVAFAQTNMDQPTQAMPTEAVKEGWQPSLINDGVYDRVPHQRKVLDWSRPREIDIMWKKRIWREIDTREKQNMPFRYPGDEYSGGGMFIEILVDAVKKGKVKAYSNYDDRFTTALSQEQILELLVGTPDTILSTDPITQETIVTIQRRDFNPDVFTKFRLKEDVLFDRNSGRMQRFIIGLAPYRDVYDEGFYGDPDHFRGVQALFWLDYEELRPVLAQYEVFNPENDIMRMTWEEFFEGNFFSARIIKVSNPFDAAFSEMNMSKIEALYEGQKVAEQLFNKEHDMWVY